MPRPRTKAQHKCCWASDVHALSFLPKETTQSAVVGSLVGVLVRRLKPYIVIHGEHPCTLVSPLPSHRFTEEPHSTVMAIRISTPLKMPVRKWMRSSA